MTSSIPKLRTASFVSTHSPTTINVPLDSRVVLSKRRSGWVRYIGKIKNEAGEWYGIALYEGKGENDGTWEKERYFDCPAHHGVFVRRKEIFCVKEYPVSRSKGPSSPVMHDNSDAGSSTGSSVDSQDTPPPPSRHSSMQSGSLAPPVPMSSSSMTQQAASVITPLIRTFKSFRKELGLQISPSKASSNNNSSSSSTATSTASPKSSTATNSSRSSGLRSPSSTRFASFASVSPTSRTASIVSQMIVTPAGNPSEASVALTHPKSQDESSSHQQPHQREEQHQQKQQSLADLMDDGNGISSLSDLYSGSANEELRTATESLAPPPSSRASSQSTRVTTFSSTTAVETMKSSRNAEPAPAPAPLFFRRANVGSPTLGRRASFSMTNSDNDGGASSPMGSSGKTSPIHLAATTRMVELEKEITVMKTNHENIVAVLRATNKQHAANVLELRAQVAALTEGNHWLEKQLASKSALIAELHAMETSDDRVPRAEVESIIAIKDAQIQTLEREITKLKQHMLRLETEKDSILCQQVKHFRLRQESDEARIHKLREDVLTMVSGHTRARNCKFDYELLPCEPVLCVMAVQ